MYINRMIDNTFKAPMEWTIVTPIRRQWRGLHFLLLKYIKRPIKISEQHNLHGIILTLTFVQTHTRKHSLTYSLTHARTHTELYHLRQLLCPTIVGGHIVFSADPVGVSVGVDVTSFLHSISLRKGWNLAKPT